MKGVYKMKLRNTILSAVMAGSLLLAGCAEKHDGCSHEVLSKRYKKAYVQIVPIFISNGKTTTISMVPMFHPENFSVEIERENKKGKLVKERLYISKENYEVLQVGDTLYCSTKTVQTSASPTKRISRAEYDKLKDEIGTEEETERGIE